MTHRPCRRTLPAALALLLWPGWAHAHLVQTGLGPYYDGVMHLLASPEDLLPCVALALLAGLQGAQAGRVGLAWLPLAWLVGGLLGLAWPSMSGVSGPSSVSTAALLVLGIGTAANRPLRAPWVAALALLTGGLLGHANGVAMAQAQLGPLGLAGIVSSVVVVVALVAAAVVSLRAPWARMGVRVLGSWLAAAGILMLAWSLRAA